VSSKFAHLAAWALLFAVAFMTLAPIELRPVSGFSVHIERFGAFAAIGLAFSLAYPRRLALVTTVVLGSVVAFEILQLLMLSRHAGLTDVAAKLVGGTCGLFAGWLVSSWRGRRAPMTIRPD
jgi:di/tricarboxylate transporter